MTAWVITQMVYRIAPAQTVPSTSGCPTKGKPLL